MHNSILKSCVTLMGILPLLFAGCTENLDDGQSAGKIATINFRMDVPEMQVATKGGENGTESDRFAFYQFSNDDTYERTYTTDYSAMGLDGKTLTYSLVTGRYTGPKKFIIIRATDASRLPKLNLGDSMQDLLAAKTPDTKSAAATPDIMSSLSADGNPWISLTEISSTPTAEADLSRKIARIDILNDPEESGLEIDKIYVKNGMTTCFIAKADGTTGDVSQEMLEISADELVDGKGFYLYPTILTSETEQTEKTVIWATTRLAGKNEVGPEVRLTLTEDMPVRANFIYELKVNKAPGQEGGFELTEKDWTDGTPSDWAPAGNCITTQTDQAEIIECTQIKGTYVKVPFGNWPYKVTKTVIDNSPEDIVMTADSKFPFWLKVKSTTDKVGENIYRHDIVYTIGDNNFDSKYITRFAITYPEGCTDDKEILTIGFLDPYPGTPLPCLSWSPDYFSPINAGQTSYLKRDRNEKAYYAGNDAFGIDQKDEFINDVAANPCPEGWTPFTDTDAKGLLEWAGGHLHKRIEQGVYTFQLFGNITEATDIRIFGGYARTEGAGPNGKDLVCFGTWPHVSWMDIDETKLTYSGTTFMDQWSISKGYGIPYRCKRAQTGWN